MDGSEDQVTSSIKADCSIDGDVSQNSGWFEVKKKNRSNGKSNMQKFPGTSKKPDGGPYRKTKAHSTRQEGREESKVNLSSVEQKDCPPAELKEQVSIKCEDMKSVHGAEAAVDSQLIVGDNINSIYEPPSTDKQMQIARDPSVITVQIHQVPSLCNTPRFKWGNLDDEDLTESNILEAHIDKSAETLQASGFEAKNEDSTICLEGGKQSSTKGLNGLETEDSGNAMAGYSHMQDMSEKSEQLKRSDMGESFAKDPIMKAKKELQVFAVEDLISSASGGDDAETSMEGVESSRQFPSENGMASVDSSVAITDFAQESSNHVSRQKVSERDTLESPVVNIFGNEHAREEDILASDTTRGPHTSAKPMVFSVAASMLMGKFEETKSGESKERFRQRLWCYLFENLNRAIDELYFLCELECDMEQIQEALLVLKEAGMDFSELKSRVEGFEKIKKHSCTPQILFGGSAGSSFPAKVEHRRPHAIAWEVRRMACSPHRAEILSSSLEAFKKVQQITAQKSQLSQSKRREASQLLDIGQSCTDLSAKKMSSVNSSSFKMEDRHKSFAKVQKPCIGTAELVDGTHMVEGIKEHDREGFCAVGSMPTKAFPSGKECNKVVMDLASNNVESKECTAAVLKPDTALPNTERTSKSTEKRVCIVDNHQREKKVPKTRSSVDAWKVKRNWEDVLSSPLKNMNRASRSPCPGWKSTERVKVLHDKLMSPERKRKSPLEMKKEVDEKQARATRIRRELENERVQRLQKTTEKLNRVSEWQAVRSTKLREGMHARQQRGESRHEAHLAEIARRAGDESSKVSEVRFITSLNEENKKLSLRQKLQDSELRRAERLQIIKTKQKEDVAREEAVLERRRIIEAERLQRLAEAQRRKEEAKARREEERKAASAAREARAVEQVRKKEVRAKAQQEVTELQAQKLIEKLRESELRRKCYLEQIRERAAMESREQASPSTRLSLSKDGQPKTFSTQAVSESDGGSIDKETATAKPSSCGSKVLQGPTSGVPTLKTPKMALHHQNLKKKVKRIRQRLTAKKYEFVEPPNGVEGLGIGSITVAASARSKIGRWLQDLQRCQLARKAGSSGVSFIVAEMIKYFDGKAAELHAARQAGLVDFIATALPASHSSKAEASQTTLSLLRILKVLLALPANRSYFVSRNLLPPLIPILSTALENFSSQDSVVISASNSNVVGTADEKLDAVGEVLSGLLECVILIINHSCSDERQNSMQEDLVELLTACEVIHHLRDLFSLFDRPQVEGAPFPGPVLFGLNLLLTLTGSRGKPVGLPDDAQLSAMLERREAEMVPSAVGDKRQGSAGVTENLLDSIEPPIDSKEEKSVSFTDSAMGELALQDNKYQSAAEDSQDIPCVASLVNSTDAPQAKDNLPPESINAPDNDKKREADGHPLQKAANSSDDINKSNKVSTNDGHPLQKAANSSDDINKSNKVSTNVPCAGQKIKEEKGQTRQGMLPVCSASISFLVSAIAETGLVGLPSLLTAVLLQSNPRSTPEQAAAILPSNFEEVATCVLKVLNNLARLDLGLVQNLLAMPDLQMEFFHLVSFLLSHCTCKWNNSTDQVASLLLETLLLLGYFALLHPGNQAVLRWGKSPTILHKICDLPFAFFSDPMLMPALVGTLLAVCYGSEQNRDVVREELSMEMLLSLLKSSRPENLADIDTYAEMMQASNDDPAPVSHLSVPMDATLEEIVQDEENIPAKEEIKRMIEDATGSDSETNSSTRHLLRALRSSSDSVSSPKKRPNKTASKAMAVTNDGEQPSLSKDMVGGRSTAVNRSSSNRMNGSSTSSENVPSQVKKTQGCISDSSSAKNGNGSGGGAASALNKRQPSGAGPPFENRQASLVPTVPADALEPNIGVCLRPDLMLQSRFPTCLLDMAQDFFAAGL